MSRKDPGPGTPKVTQDPGPQNIQVGPKNQDPKVFKWDLEPLIFFRFNRLFFTLLDLNISFFTCDKTLH